MAGKTIQQLTSAELRSECAIRDISISGTKADLVIRLEENFRENGQNPEDVRFHTVQPLTTGLTGSTGEQSYATSTLVDAETRRSNGQSSGGNAAALRGQLTPADDQPGQSVFRATTHRDESTHAPINGIFETAAEQLRLLTQTLPQTTDSKSFEARLMALEASMTRFFTETRQAAPQQPLNNPTPRFPIHPSPVQVTARTHDSYQSGRPYEHNDGGAQTGTSHIAAANERPFFARDTLQTHASHTTHDTSYSARAQERSVLIPYEDLRTARSSLPEFYGTRAEDPVRFMDNTESILAQAHIHPSGWCRAVEPQLKGTASTWYNSIRALDLSWTEFREEFLENFNNAEIQSRLRADIVSTHQAPKQTLTEFVLTKNQLARRVNTGLSEPELVGIIAGLTRDAFRTHIRLHRPQTFSELRRIAGVLDPVTDSTNPPPKQWTPTPKKTLDTPRRAPPVKKKSFTRSSDDRPPGPCKYCGELHWQSACPHRPTRSGNGGGVDED